MSTRSTLRSARTAANTERASAAHRRAFSGAWGRAFSTLRLRISMPSQRQLG